MNLNKSIKATYDNIRSDVNDTLFSLVDSYGQDLLSTIKKFVVVVLSEIKDTTPSSIGSWDVTYPEKIIVDPEYLVYDRDLPLQVAYMINRNAGVSVILNRKDGHIVAIVVVDGRSVSKKTIGDSKDLVEEIKKYL